MGCCCGAPRRRLYDETRAYLVRCPTAPAAEALGREYLPAEATPIPASVAGRVAVFYLHPTLHFFSPKCNVWSEPSTSMKNDLIRVQVGPFLGFGPIFAPFYREATIMAYSFNTARATRALELAYGDVESAFDQFIAEIPPDMPFFLVGHSQGSDHLVKLFARRFQEDSPGHVPGLAQRVVCAYLGGVLVGDDTFAGSTGIRLADGPREAGGVAVAWASVVGDMERPRLASGLPSGGGNAYSHFTTQPRLSNPVSWEVGPGARADADAHAGALCGGQVRPGSCGCAVRAAACEVTDASEEALALPHWGQDYHLCDFELWWQCIRANAVERARAALGETG